VILWSLSERGTKGPAPVPSPSTLARRRALSTAMLAAVSLTVLAATACGADAPADGYAGSVTAVPGSTAAPPIVPGSGNRATTSARPPASTTTSIAPIDLHGVDFANMAYPADSCTMLPTENGRRAVGEYTVHDGRFDGGATGKSVDIGDIRYGDVNGDGRDEAVVHLACHTGPGSARRIHPWVYTADTADITGIRRLAFSRPTDEELAVAGLRAGGVARTGTGTVVDGVLVVEWQVMAAPAAAGAAATPWAVTTHQRWNGRDWETTVPATGRPSG
jgi:hypothetical protein